MSAKQKYLVIAAILVTVAVAAALFFYSMANRNSYDGIFVSGVRQVRMR